MIIWILILADITAQAAVPTRQDVLACLELAHNDFRKRDAAEAALTARWPTCEPALRSAPVDPERADRIRRIRDVGRDRVLWRALLCGPVIPHSDWEGMPGVIPMGVSIEANRKNQAALMAGFREDPRLQTGNAWTHWRAGFAWELDQWLCANPYPTIAWLYARRAAELTKQWEDRHK